MLTRQLVAAGELLDFQVHDHLILAHNTYSFAPVRGPRRLLSPLRPSVSPWWPGPKSATAGDVLGWLGIVARATVFVAALAVPFDDPALVVALAVGLRGGRMIFAV